MKLRIASVLLTSSLTIILLVGVGRAGDDKGGWKPFLTKDIYKELLSREGKTVLEVVGKTDEASIKKGQAAALMAAAYTWNVKDGKVDEVAKTRATALALALFVKGKDETKVKKYASVLATGTGDDAIASPPGNPKDFAELHDIMVMYTFKSKGGDGVYADLQLNKKLKTTQNSIEELIRTLSRKAPEGEVLDKAAKELELLAYRVAVNGALTWHYTPKEKVAEWRKQAELMRDSGISLAEAARKKDGEGIVKAATLLNNTCTDCHATFRK